MDTFSVISWANVENLRRSIELAPLIFSMLELSASMVEFVLYF